MRVDKEMKENRMTSLKMGDGVRRILFIFIALLVVCHLTACFWYLIASLEGMNSDNWVVRYDLTQKSTFEVLFI